MNLNNLKKTLEVYIMKLNKLFFKSGVEYTEQGETRFYIQATKLYLLLITTKSYFKLIHEILIGKYSG